MSSIGSDLSTQLSIQLRDVTPIVPLVDFVVVRTPYGVVAPCTNMHPPRAQPAVPAGVTLLAVILTKQCTTILDGTKQHRQYVAMTSYVVWHDVEHWKTHHIRVEEDSTEPAVR